MFIQAYRRKEPITVTLGASVINFVPNKAGHIVADVSDAHVETLLAISEAYVEYDETDLPDDAPVQSLPSDKVSIKPADAPPPEDAGVLARRAQVLVGHSNGLEGTVAIDGNDVEVAALLDAAFKRSGLTKSGWNAQDQTDIDTAVDTEANSLVLASAETKAAKTAKELPSKWLIVNGTEKMDLSKLDDKQLRAFAKSASITVAPGLRGDKIRTLIFKALKA